MKEMTVDRANAVIELAQSIVENSTYSLYQIDAAKDVENKLILVVSRMRDVRSKANE